MNLSSAGAKLVLPPAGEIPQLKPVNANRPRMPPPQTPNGKLTYMEFYFIQLLIFVFSR